MRARYIQYSTATSGTVSLTDTTDDIQLIHDAASLAVTMTIAFPSTPIDGQTIYLQSVLGVTTLTLSASVGTIIGGITTLAAGSVCYYAYRISNTKWYKV